MKIFKDFISLGGLESRELGGFYFLQKQKVAKTFSGCASRGLIFLDSSNFRAEVALGKFVGFQARNCEIRLGVY